MSEVIAVVDDDVSRSRPLMQMLRFLGYKAVLLQDASKALQYILEHVKQVHVVILDILLPEGDLQEILLQLKYRTSHQGEQAGYVVCRVLLERVPSVRVIVHSVHRSPKIETELSAKGVMFMHKPCSLAKLIAIIEETL